MNDTEKLGMRTASIADGNFATLAKLFPDAVTETIVGYEPILDKDGKQVVGLDGIPKERAIVERSIDADVLAQEINTHVVSGKEERYQFTWPDKKKAILLANAPIAAALRPCREESVDFDNTENLYIEGDNLDVLKLLRETYLNRVKMIYIDPPYNTGNDFVYNDDFSQDVDEYSAVSGDYDEQGNRLVKNFDRNGRFHTDWLNMIYPRLRVARDLLRDDGVIFISIDDNEVENLLKVCNEVFGEPNRVCNFIWKSKLGKVGTTSTISSTHEYIVCYAKNISNLNFRMIEKQSDGRKESLRQWGQADRREDRPSMWYPITINGITVYPIKDDGTEGRWRVGQETCNELLNTGCLELAERNGKYNVYRNFPSDISVTPYDTLLLDDIGTTAKGAIALKDLDMSKIFDYSKPVELIRFFAFLCTSKEDIILDFFSGSATTAHAVMQLNVEDCGKRKFVMVQLPEPCDEKSEAYKAGYKNICEIGKERIRRAGKKIKEENKDKSGIEKLDTGFRVLKLDSSNMKDVYYTPEEYAQMNFALDGFMDNIKEDRTDEDLLFQVMLDLGIPLSAKIEQNNGAFYVNDNYLIAFFDKVNTDIITEIAKEKPYYAVFRDSSFLSDSALVNFEQVFNTYSPKTIRRVL